MTTMRRRADTVSRALPALLTAFVASIVLGIIGMHALSTHGVTRTTDHSAMTSAVTSPMTGAHEGMSTSPVPSPETGEHAGVPAVADGGDGRSLRGMVMLCFAMLAATAGALLLLLLGICRRPRAWAHRLHVPTTVTRWATAHLGTGPPYVWSFSVIRC